MATSVSRHNWLAILSMVSVLSLGSLMGYAALPDIINYQGFLKDGAGNPVNASHDVVFTIYNAPTGGNAVWTSAWSTATGGAVNFQNGVFAVGLGSRASLSDVDFSRQLYLGIKVDTDQEMTPRLEIGGTPFAFQAGRRASMISIDCDAADTIQQAINEAPIGGEVTIDIDGTCNEDVVIRRNGVTLTSSSSATIIGQGGGDGGIISAVTIDGAKNVSISDLRIQAHAEGYGLVVRENGSVSAMEIDITGSAGGIQALRGGFVNLSTGTTIVTDGKYGLLVQDGAGASVQGADITVDNNTPGDNGGVACYRGGNVRIRGTNTIKNRGPDGVELSGDEGFAVLARWNCDIRQESSGPTTTSTGIRVEGSGPAITQGDIGFGGVSSGSLLDITLNGDIRVERGAYLMISNEALSTRVTTKSIVVEAAILEVLNPQLLSLDDGTLLVDGGSQALFASTNLGAPGPAAVRVESGSSLFLFNGTDWVVEGSGAESGIDLGANSTLTIGGGAPCSLSTIHRTEISGDSTIGVEDGCSFTTGDLDILRGGLLGGDDNSTITVNGRFQMFMFARLWLGDGAKLDLTGTAFPLGPAFIYQYSAVFLGDGSEWESSIDVNVGDTRIKANSNVTLDFKNAKITLADNAQIDGETGFTLTGDMDINGPNSELNFNGAPRIQGHLTCSFGGNASAGGAEAGGGSGCMINGCSGLSCAP